MHKPLVTIFAPIYNAEPHLEKLFDSVLNQTYENIEFLLIDDMSTDGSAKVISEYAEKDNRVRLVRRKEKGGTAAKGEEFAIPLMRGEYYFYLSQDDFMDYDLIEKCMEKVEKTGAEVIVADMIWYYEDRKENKGIYPPQNDYDQILDPRRAFELSLDWKLHGYILRSMRVVRALNYKAKYYNSDEFYTRKSFLICNKVAFADTKAYYRQDNGEAITKSKHYFDIDIIHVNIQLLEVLIKYRYDRELIRKRWKSAVRQTVKYIPRSDFRKWNLYQKFYIVKGTFSALCKLIAIGLFFHLKK